VNIEDVMERFALMADLNTDRAEKFRPVCEDAMAEISRRAVLTDVEGQRVLCAAAAALALYRWALMASSGDLGSFSAGDVKITKSGANVAMAKEAWREAAAAAAPYMQDSEFLFRGVPS